MGTSKTAFVTGATGFIGLNLIRQLLDRGWSVTAFHQPSSDLTYLHDLPINRKVGTITEPATLKEAIPERVDALFHLAGSTNMWRARNEQQRLINVDGTRYLFQAALNAGARCLVHTSSVAAWGQVEGVIDEDTPKKGGESWVNYEATKFEGEQIALDYASQDNGLRVVVTNPSQVVGPYDTGNWGRLFMALPKGELPAITNGVMSIAHVREVAKAHINAAEQGTNGACYLLGGRHVSMREFVKMIADVEQLPPKKIPPTVPGALLSMIGSASDFLSRLHGREPDITPELANMMTRKNVRFSSAKAIRELGYEIPPVEETVRDCYNWLKKGGFVSEPS